MPVQEETPVNVVHSQSALQWAAIDARIGNEDNLLIVVDRHVIQE